jgi:acyl carrier protein
VDWAAVLAGSGGQQVELPTYAFQRDRYWLPAPAPTAAGPGGGVEGEFWELVERGDVGGLAGLVGAGEQAWGEVAPVLGSWRRGLADRAVVAGWRYGVRWVPVSGLAVAGLGGRWVVVAAGGGEGLAGVVAAGLGELGAEVDVVVVEVAGLDRDALAGRLAGVAGEGPPVTGVVSVLGVEGRDVGGCGVPAGLWGSVLLVQALADAGMGGRLWCVTQGAVVVEDTGEPGDVGAARAVAAGEAGVAAAAGAAAPGAAAAGGQDAAGGGGVAAMVWGLGRVAALEIAGGWGGLVDLPLVVDAGAVAALGGVLAGGHGEDQVAVRGGAVWARRLVRLPAGNGAAGNGAAGNGAAGNGGGWRPRGTVVVTGGLGGVGRHVVRWLGRGGATQVVVLSRSGGGAQDAGAATDGAGGVGELAAELAGWGCQLSVVSCDIADEQALAGVVAGLGGPVRAVVHLAAEVELGPLLTTGLDQLAANLRAKAGGARALDTVFATTDLDAFVLFSSIAGLWGSASHGGYAAANAYLDALARHRRARGLKATSIAWGIWDAYNDSADAQMSVRQGLPLLDTGLALDALQQALDNDETFVAVADVDWDRFTPLFTSARPSPLLEGVPEAQRSSQEGNREEISTGLSERLTRMPEAEQARALLDLVRTHVARVLRHSERDTIEPGQPFKDLWFDSLTAVELRDRLNAVTGRRLPTTLIFDYPTPTALAAFLQTELLGDGVVTATSIHTQLAQIGTVLVEGALPVADRASIEAHLKSLLSALNGRTNGESSKAEQLDDASDDEIFAFIRKEFGGPATHG